MYISIYNKNIYTYPYNKIIKNEYKMRDKLDLEKKEQGL